MESSWGQVALEQKIPLSNRPLWQRLLFVLAALAGVVILVMLFANLRKVKTSPQNTEIVYGKPVGAVPVFRLVTGVPPQPHIPEYLKPQIPKH